MKIEKETQTTFCLTFHSREDVEKFRLIMALTNSASRYSESSFSVGVQYMFQKNIEGRKEALELLRGLVDEG